MKDTGRASKSKSTSPRVLVGGTYTGITGIVPRLTDGVYVYDVWLVAAGDNTDRLAEGLKPADIMTYAAARLALIRRGVWLWLELCEASSKNWAATVALVMHAPSEGDDE